MVVEKYKEQDVYKYFFTPSCLKTALQDKAVILVTHQLQYLQESDKILVMHQVNRLSQRLHNLRVGKY